MRSSFGLSVWVGRGHALVLCLVLAGCHGPQSMFEGAGTEGGEVIKLWWVLFGVGSFVTAAVLGFLVAGCYRNYQGSRPPASDRHLRRALGVGTGITVLLLLVLLLAAHRYSQPFAEAGGGAPTIEVTGKRWWWEVAYLDGDGERLFETANEIHIPAGAAVRLRLLSDNVIHSFWVPGLGGKVDLIPGRTNHMWLEARRPGVYRGQCAEFCGVQHAKMAFLVIAEPAEEFAEWMARQQEPAVEPSGDLARQGREVFRESGCANCHAIRGVAGAPVVSGIPQVVGPDLTHLAARETLAAATLPNTRGHLGGWVLDAQSVKPGNLMPRFSLGTGEFHALLHYLETLK